MSYLDAVRSVRLLLGQLEGQLGNELVQVLEAYAEQLEAAIADLPPARQFAVIEASHILRNLARELDDALAQIIDKYRALSFQQTEALLQRAHRLLVESEVPGATFGGVSAPPPILMWNQYASLNAAQTWKTLLRTYAFDAAAEADEIVKQAILKAWDPIELSKRLRRYVEGADTFAHLFEDQGLKGLRIDLRTIPRHLRGEAQQLDYNARRIAISELHNARAEADVQHFIADPLVIGVRWTLSPDRGTLIPPDQCDVLATADVYGMGPGCYPVHRVPLPPHPFDRCNRVPVMRKWAQRLDPKPNPQADWRALTGMKILDGVSSTRWHSILQAAHDAARSVYAD